MFKVIRAVARVQLFACVLLLLSGCKQPEVFYIENVAPALQADHMILKSNPQEFALVSDENFLVTGHRIVKGEGVVVGIRKFEKRGKMDSDIFEKLTISFPNGLGSGSGTINLSENSEDTLVYYSFGSSPFPHSGCFGYADSGTIGYRVIDKKELQLDLRLKIKTSGSRQTITYCKEVEVQETIIAKHEDLDHLTPWQGKPGNHIYDETYDR